MKTWFERAIFLSWYCAKGDCRFCWMSTQKNRIRDPKKAVRRPESILAEVIITRACGWRIEFLSGGYESYELDFLVELVRKITVCYGDKVWLNMGAINVEPFRPYLRGVCGALETPNPVLHDELCPSKPIRDIETMFAAEIPKAITIIIGIGEELDDFSHLENFIQKHKVSRITFYALNPHKGTGFTKGPDKEYYCSWVRKTRKRFPEIEIIAGSWTNRLDEIHLLLEAGADALTKFKSIKLFGSEYARQIEAEVRKAGYEFQGTMTEIPEKEIWDIWKSLPFTGYWKEKIKHKLEEYIAKMKTCGSPVLHQ